MLVLLIGTVMIAITIAVHAAGSARWLTYVSDWRRRHTDEDGTRHLFAVVISTATVLVLLHAFEAFFWALLYVSLPGQAGLENLDQAMYFSMATITTLGYGDVTLSKEWSMLSGMEAMVGITVFGLTTALHIEVIRRARIVSKKEK